MIMITTTHVQASRKVECRELPHSAITRKPYFPFGGTSLQSMKDNAPNFTLQEDEVSCGTPTSFDRDDADASQGASPQSPGNSNGSRSVHQTSHTETSLLSSYTEGMHQGNYPHHMDCISQEQGTHHAWAESEEDHYSPSLMVPFDLNYQPNHREQSPCFPQQHSNHTSPSRSLGSHLAHKQDQHAMPKVTSISLPEPCQCCRSCSTPKQDHTTAAYPGSSSCISKPQGMLTYNQNERLYPLKVIVVPPQQHDRSIYRCDECGQQFTKESNLRKHIERLTQTVTPPYFKCKYCNHIFKSKEARKRHQPVHKICTADSYSRVCCSVCGYRFSSKEKLQHHLHRFTENPDERIFKCFFCSHAFTTDFSRNRHEGQMHTDAHKLPCCCCGKLFSNRYKLKLHRIKQQIQRPPRCMDCGWVFAAQEYLDDHQRQVQRNLPLECLICHHRYQSQLALLRHLKFHTRKLQFECPSCLGRFSSENLLTKHLRTATRRAITTTTAATATEYQ